MIHGTPAQLDQLNRVLAMVWERNPFYRAKWKAAGLSPGLLRSLDELERFPFTTRAELERDQASHPPLGSNLTAPFSDCLRLHRSSGTTRAPLFWADDAVSWQAVVRCSQTVWEWADVGRGDRVFFAMPFGVSSGLWIMRAGAQQLGCLCFSAGQASVEEQLEWMGRLKPTVLVAKPRNLLTLALAASAAGLNPASLGARKLICGGAPGGHVAETRRQLEQRWGAECFDRYGMTEAGSIAGECAAHAGGLHLLDHEFLAEAVEPHPPRPSNDGPGRELVLTHLSRTACPIVRYRTGDLVQLDRAQCCPCGHLGTLLVGGVQRVSAKPVLSEVAPPIQENLYEHQLQMVARRG